MSSSSLERRQLAPPPQLAPPSRPVDPSSLFIRTLALCAFEVIEGLRGHDQLGGWVVPEVLASLITQQTLRRERNDVYRLRRRIVPSPGNVTTSRPSDVAVESVVVMHTDHRSSAVAIRLEYIRGRWRATQLHIL